MCDLQIQTMNFDGDGTPYIGKNRRRVGASPTKKLTKTGLERVANQGYRSSRCRDY